jgi:hypothetical protein
MAALQVNARSRATAAKMRTDGGNPGIQREVGEVLARLADEAPPLSPQAPVAVPAEAATSSAAEASPHRRRRLDPLSKYRCCGRRVSFHQLQTCLTHALRRNGP